MLTPLTIFELGKTYKKELGKSLVYAAVQERMLFFRYQKGIRVEVLRVGQYLLMEEGWNYGTAQNLLMESPNQYFLILGRTILFRSNAFHDMNKTSNSYCYGKTSPQAKKRIPWC